MPPPSPGPLQPSAPLWARAMEARLAGGPPRRSDLFWTDPCRVMTAAGMTPDPWQRRVLQSTSPRLLICAARQFGKSRVVGALVARTAIVQSPALILILSRALRQSKEFFRKHVVDVFQRL